MQQEMFTCRYIVFEDKLCPVHWLRLDLARVSYGKSQLRLLRLNDQFIITVKPFRLTDELENLYAWYLGSVNFDAPESVEACLLGGATNNVFDTQLVEVRDGKRLIAAGIFDNGLRSIAGIMNFYDPDYRKYSLGKYLMLQKMAHAQSQRKQFYYPGYIATNCSKFDYKLFVCEAATEVLDENRGNWLPFSWAIVGALAAEMMAE